MCNTKINLLVTLVPLLCLLCSAQVKEVLKFRKDMCELNPFLQEEACNPSRHKKSSFKVRTPLEILYENPFLKNISITIIKNERSKIISESFNDTDAEITAVCGISSPLRLQHLIVGGYQFEEGKYPWLGALFSVGDHGMTFICAGTLIYKKHLLTAGHCVEKAIVDPQSLVVSLGKSDIRNLTISDPSIYKVETVYRHPDYRLKSADGDIAVVVLQTEICFNRILKPACLWSGNNILSDIIGKLGTVVGWGTTDNGTKSFHRPREARLPIASQANCFISFPSLSNVADRTFCAGFQNNTGPCDGDSGSGLVILRNGRYIMRGVVSLSGASHSATKCDLNDYVIFTDVSKFVSWIHGILRK